MRALLPVLTITAAGLAGSAWAADTLTPHGLARVSIGMTVPQAEAALGAKLDVEAMGEEQDADECGFASPPGTAYRGIGYVVEDGKIVRIDVDATDPAHQPPPLATEQGIGVGSTEEQVRQAYGTGLTVWANHTTPGPANHTIKALLPDGKEGFLFETVGGKVNYILAGGVAVLRYGLCE